MKITLTEKWYGLEYREVWHDSDFRFWLNFNWFGGKLFKKKEKKERNPEAELQGPVYLDTTNCLIIFR